MRVPLMFLSEWHEFPSAPCLAGKKKLDDSSRLHVVEIARVAWHASFQPLWEEKTCNSTREQTPLSNDTIDSVLRHREIGRAKDLSAPPCINIPFSTTVAARRDGVSKIQGSTMHMCNCLFLCWEDFAVFYSWRYWLFIELSMWMKMVCDVFVLQVSTLQRSGGDSWCCCSGGGN